MTGNYKFIFLFPIIFLLPSISCSRREDRDEIARYQSFAEIVQREDGGGKCAADSKVLLLTSRSGPWG